MVRSLYLGAAAVALSVGLIGCANGGEAGAEYAGAETTVAEGGADASAEAMEETTTVGGAEMYPSRNIVENAANSADHTTLVAAVKAAALADALSGPGPLTVFAPTNAAFDALPAGTVETLLKPENKEKLVKILTAHVVAQDLEAADLIDLASSNGGKAKLTTLSGDTLTFWTESGKAYVTDESGGKAEVTIADVDQSNGVIHVVDKVLLPK